MNRNSEGESPNETGLIRLNSISQSINLQWDIEDETLIMTQTGFLESDYHAISEICSASEQPRPSFLRNSLDVSEISEFNELMRKATIQALSMEERPIALKTLKIIAASEIGITPVELSGLVDNNWEIAVHFLLKLLHDKAANAEQYLDTIIMMELSVKSMEVVNRLTSEIGLPEEFLLSYISHSIRTCEKMEDNKYAKNRLVRLLCAFLQHLIRNDKLNLQLHHMYLQIRNFCVEFICIREASALYRLINERNDKKTGALETTKNFANKFKRVGKELQKAPQLKQTLQSDGNQEN